MRFPILHPHLGKDKFSLDSSGIAGFFGGEEAFAAMNSVHLIPGRRWMGWYNSPGSYFVAKKYGILPDSTFWDGLFPGPTVTPAKLLELDAKSGPRYTGVYSGTQLATTGHLSYLIARYCENPDKVIANGDFAANATSSARRDKTASTTSSAPELSPRPGAGSTFSPLVTPIPSEAKPAEKHRDIVVTVVDFADFDEKNWNVDSKVAEKHFQPIPPLGITGIMATIFFSFASSVLAALYGDWFSFSMILYGTFANGITLLVLGTGNLCLDLKKPSEESPPGHGVMWDSKNIIIVQGTERIISTILHSGYRLEYSRDRKYHKIGYCSILLLVQFLLQLFLIPQGKLIGQILFLSTLAMSWICNGYLASFDREEMQTELLFKVIGRKPACYKFTSDRWSAAVAFTMAYFDFEDAKPEGILDELIPNNTPSWNLWKSCICGAIKSKCLPSYLIRDPPSNNDSNTTANAVTSFHECKNAFNDLKKDKDQKFVESFLAQADKAFGYVENARNGLEKAIEEANKSSKNQKTGESDDDNKSNRLNHGTAYIERASQEV